MIKDMIEINGQKIVVKEGDIQKCDFCDRCGVLIGEQKGWSVKAVIVKAPYDNLSQLTGCTFGSGDYKGNKYKRVCEDCEKIVSAVIDSPENDAIIRQAFGIRPEPKTKNKEGSHENNQNQSS